MRPDGSELKQLSQAGADEQDVDPVPRQASGQDRLLPPGRAGEETGAGGPELQAIEPEEVRGRAAVGRVEMEGVREARPGAPGPKVLFAPGL